MDRLLPVRPNRDTIEFYGGEGPQEPPATHRSFTQARSDDPKQATRSEDTGPSLRQSGRSLPLVPGPLGEGGIQRHRPGEVPARDPGPWSATPSNPSRGGPDPNSRLASEAQAGRFSPRNLQPLAREHQ